MKQSWGYPKRYTPAARRTVALAARGAIIQGRGVTLGGGGCGSFEAWAKRDLSELKVRYIFLDGWYPRVRNREEAVHVPVLVTLGVCANGQRVVLDVGGVGGGERAGVAGRGAGAGRAQPGYQELAVIDGNPGLRAAPLKSDGGIAIQRCTNHKLWNLLGKAPAPFCARNWPRTTGA